METALDILRKARELVASGWTTNNYARDAVGSPVNTTDAAAATYCATGSIYAAAGFGVPMVSTDSHVVPPAVAEAARSVAYCAGALTGDAGLLQGANAYTGLPDGELLHGLLPEWNDAEGRTLDQVCAAFDSAIAAVQDMEE